MLMLSAAYNKSCFILHEWRHAAKSSDKAHTSPLEASFTQLPNHCPPTPVSAVPSAAGGHRPENQQHSSDRDREHSLITVHMSSI